YATDVNTNLVSDITDAKTGNLMGHVHYPANKFVPDVYTNYADGSATETYQFDSLNRRTRVDVQQTSTLKVSTLMTIGTGGGTGGHSETYRSCVNDMCVTGGATVFNKLNNPLQEWNGDISTSTQLSSIGYDSQPDQLFATGSILPLGLTTSV